MTGGTEAVSVPGAGGTMGFRQPAGVVAVISPWNFPLQLPSQSVAPALATGNAVALKHTPRSFPV